MTLGALVGAGVNVAIGAQIIKGAISINPLEEKEDKRNGKKKRKNFRRL